MSFLLRRHPAYLAAITLTIHLLLLAPTTSAQQVTGLDGWDIFLDPGHSQNENVGVFGYSEAHKVLRVGLELRRLLLETTDIDTVYLSRTNDFVSVSLSQRVDHANFLGAAYFHSIHSNAAGPAANNVFVLWPQYKDGREAVPNGGKAMAEIMSDDLGQGMRIPSLGGIGECDFYGVASCREQNVGAGKGGSRNFVQSFTNMASSLSEAGFHTNPTQNQRNMNADWKRLEAKAMYWSVLDFHGLERPSEHIVTGIVSDFETGEPVNGAVVTIADTSYTTDTFESLFHQFTSDPDRLRNGFYYLDNLPSGELTVHADADGFMPIDSVVTPIDTFFTFFDLQLISTALPTVASSVPAPGEERFRLVDPIVIDFSRRMNRTSVEDAFSIDPEVSGTFSWSRDDTRLTFRPDSLLPETAYTVRIEQTAEGAFGHAFDGDEDAEEGGAFELAFVTSPTDVTAPTIVDGFPRPRTRDIPRELVLTYEFSEVIDPSSLNPELFSLAATSGGSAVPGQISHHVVNDQSVVSFYPEDLLAVETSYTFRIAPGLRDIAGNEVETERTIPFTTSDVAFESTPIDPVEPSFSAEWWQPQQSGSTSGIVTDSTSFTRDSDPVNLLTGSTESRRLDYGWDAESENPLVRVCFSNCSPAGNVSFDTSYLLQAYVFGDGSGNRFRFALDDQTDHEVSPWFTIDWLGWRLVSWDLSTGETGSWIGNGVLESPFTLDSFQLTSDEGSERFGSVWFDDLRVAREVTGTAVEDVAELPDGFALHQNYPNPFNPSTTLSFALAAPGEVTLTIYNAVGAEVASLADGSSFAAGTHALTWNAADLPSGVYFARLQSGGRTKSVKLVLLKR